jgi:hypothetical protein
LLLIRERGTLHRAAEKLAHGGFIGAARGDARVLRGVAFEQRFVVGEEGRRVVRSFVPQQRAPAAGTNHAQRLQARL